MSDAEDRTQAPSDKRLSRAREEGQAPLSRELVTLMGLIAAALMMSLALPSTLHALGAQLSQMMVDTQVTPGEAIQRAAAAWTRGALAFMAVIGIAGAATVLLQTNLLIHGGAIGIDLSRVSPIAGMKRVFGKTNLVEALKGLAKLGILAWAFWRALQAVQPLLGTSALWTADHLLSRIGQELQHLLLLVVAAQAFIALLDVGWTRWNFQQRLRMSREDMKDESRESEGDPKIKARLRQLRHARARRRMMAAVAKATVVVTNPTHYAVALAYDRGGNAAPRIVAKGMDDVAARIRQAAEKAGVPLVANPPLARALYLVPLDAEVPAEHFRTVAEIIAYVWRLRGQVTGR